MSNLPQGLSYVESHEWIRNEGDGIVTIGVTDFAQEQLGDVVFVELPDVGAELVSADEFGVIESVKAASDLFAPVSGEVIAINELLADDPELVNTDPYGDAWLLQIRLSHPEELEHLLDADAYSQLCEE
ncbi:glycine cleavage system protein GcvH [Oceanospirillaceae bacterium]|jgi:glycine cleavage system H protein|uniref:glycine cleavage system protein GcvH n=1 Tax=Candidatus Njordibacter sp. Uisw_002 TaxID=3230971 RepID=UPI00233417DF|nr:glycine cleavage system protein GcvH [Oceanospirillaceae bacterium]MDB9958551.1 glycine cleavage system protein GcvH [Oceanospirillaceae bacterium]MDC1509102.1 glycine cleavage system protein GcvH [Oceanospirillaceae bacterium]|tara:strand:- start:1170 stop:1556 length:387 start_codon:yes stop_codon:yes gene_type:complete